MKRVLYREREIRCLSEICQDMHFAWRRLARSPSFTTVAVLSLALGVGATTAIFSVMNALLIRPLPYKEPGRLVTLGLINPKLQLGFEYLPVSASIFLDWKNHSRSFAQMAAYVPEAWSLGGSGLPEYVGGVRMSSSMFEMLGIKPQIGRAFSAAEDEAGHDDVVVISYQLWQDRFGGDTEVLGKHIFLNGKPHTIIGVMPRGVHFPGPGEVPSYSPRFPATEVWKPIAFTVDELKEVGDLNYWLLARLKPSTNTAAARADLNGLIQGGTPNAHDWGAAVFSFDDQIVGGVRPVVLMLFAAAGFLLLITCANLANLLLANGAKRQGEIAVRLALGAQRWRLVRQLLTETALLGLVGGIAGSVLGYGGLKIALRFAPEGIPRLRGLALDLHVLGFAVAISAVTGVFFGLAPALSPMRSGVWDALRTSGRGTLVSGGRRTRQMLVIVEIALSLILLTWASLLAKSLRFLTEQASGFRSEGVLTMHIPLQTLFDEQRLTSLVRDLASSCASLPGVEAAGVIDVLPFTGETQVNDVTIEGSLTTQPATTFIDFRAVTSGYRHALGTPLEAGRDLTEFDRGAVAPVALINQAAAHRLWPGGGNPIGRRFRPGASKRAPWITVVGIVADVHAAGLDAPVRPQIFFPYEQYPPTDVYLVLRSVRDPISLTAEVRNVVSKINENIPISDVRLMSDLVSASVSRHRFQTILVGLFAVLALVLAAVGIYGVVSYSATQRLHEIGLRMALGAQRHNILTLLLREGFGLAIVGSACGAAGTFALTPALRASLYGVVPSDPSVFIAAACILLTIVLTACYVPAHRASRADPNAALRCE